MPERRGAELINRPLNVLRRHEGANLKIDNLILSC